jgi:UDP-galactopyranose mutase
MQFSNDFKKQLVVFGVKFSVTTMYKEKFMKKYDYLIVGCGLFGAVFAHEAKQKGKSVLIIEKRDHIGGNIYCAEEEGILVHKYGAHIFHTSNKAVWNYVNQFVEFNNFVNSPIANYKGEIYNMPFNMNTFSKMFGVATPKEAERVIEEQRAEIKGEPKNLEEQAISLVGREIYTKLIKGYTEKQWGRDCKDLPAFIIKRLPVRYTYNNNYFNDRYQGIPIEGYTVLVERLIEGCDVRLNTDFFADREMFLGLADKCLYTGTIDGYFDYIYGKLGYRSLRFENEVLDEPNHQGVAVVNYTEREIPYTRIIEHKHFAFGTQPKTIITKEYPVDWEEGMEPYYPINDEENNALYARYVERAAKEPNVIFGGRLGMYKYYDMDKCIEAALALCEKEL